MRRARRKLSLETPNRENAAVRAREIYQLARAVGWDAVLQTGPRLSTIKII